MLELYIDGRLADFSQEDIVIFSKTKIDFTNPTAVKNSFSKTITLAGTNANDLIFNDIWHLDHRQMEQRFNPSKRVSFILSDDGSVIESGYLKMDKINYDGPHHSYNVTLYGEMGAIIYSLRYAIDPDTDESRDLTLGDLDYGEPLDININQGTVISAWRRLEGDDRYPEIYDTLNFMVAYNGKPSADNFDAKHVWINTADQGRCVFDGEEFVGAPTSVTKVVEGVSTEFKAINTMITKSDPDDTLGLLELPSDCTDIEMRDFRSYLLRPVIKLSKVIDAIDRYIAKDGWRLDTSDPFFSTDVFTTAWITLSMLYEIKSDVQSFDDIDQAMLLSETSAPSEYLVSMCKTFGLYIDTDVAHRRLIVRSKEKFFTGEIHKMDIDYGGTINVNPLSFDKTSYTFDYADGASQLIDAYNDLWGMRYGSKAVYTGFAFGDDSEEYIKNNAYRNGIDTMEQSPYYRYVNGLSAPLTGQVSGELKYTLFSDTGEAYTAPIAAAGILTNTIGGKAIYQYGQYGANWMRKGVLYDGNVRLQCHSEDNGGVDGKNIFVRYNGMVTTDALYKPLTSRNWNIASDQHIQWLISDDNPLLRDYNGGKNCWFASNLHSNAGMTTNWLVREELPSFTRCRYTSNYEIMSLGGNDVYLPWIKSLENDTLTKGREYMTYTSNTTISTSYPYVEITMVPGHKYLLISNIHLVSATEFQPYPSAIRNYREIDMYMASDPAMIFSTTAFLMECQAPRSVNVRVCPFRIKNGTAQMRWFMAYDLTAMGLDGVITTARDGVRLMNPNDGGYPLVISDTFDFGPVRELYVPGAVESADCDLYSRWWRSYITDLYDVNTRVMECRAMIDDLHESFRRFWFYQDVIWVLSKAVDWNPDTKMAKCTFIKVNDTRAYTEQ